MDVLPYESLKFPDIIDEVLFVDQKSHFRDMEKLSSHLSKNPMIVFVH